MFINYVYPTTRTLRRLNPEKIINLQRNRPTFGIFPVVEEQEWRLEWEQLDNYRGMQQLRGLNGEPSYVKMTGFKQFGAEPGAFGEYMTVDEKKMTVRAQGIMDFRPVNISDLVIKRQEYLNVRETDLLEYTHWSILLNGVFVFTGPNGARFTDSFPIQTIDMSDWSDLDASTPFFDLLSLKLLVNGISVSFGTQATIFANTKTIMNLLRNRNPDDLGGMALEGIRQRRFISLEEANRIFLSQGLPTVVEYNEGYNRESDGAFINWIPDDVISVIGARTNGDALGEYRMVRNVNNPGGTPGRYTLVIDHLARRVPRLIEIHQGHNGGAVVFYGSAIIRGNV